MIDDVIGVDDKVKTSYGDGFVTEMRQHEKGRICRVSFPDGFENWYFAANLEKLPYKEKYVRPRL